MIRITWGRVKVIRITWGKGEGDQDHLGEGGLGDQDHLGEGG